MVTNQRKTQLIPMPVLLDLAVFFNATTVLPRNVATLALFSTCDLGCWKVFKKSCLYAALSVIVAIKISVFCVLTLYPLSACLQDASPLHFDLFKFSVNNKYYIFNYS